MSYRERTGHADSRTTWLTWRYTAISELTINKQIRDEEIRLISEDREQLDIMPGKEALKMAQEVELDLVKAVPTAGPPVCKIIDYGKYRYKLARKEREVKKKQKVVEVKGVRLSPNINTNDLNTKVGAARKFLEKDDKVKVTPCFHGCEITHVFKSKYILDGSAESLEDIAAMDKPPEIERRGMVMFLTAKRQSRKF